MTPTEAIATLQAFGEGIHPTRDLYEVSPTHRDWHTAVAALTGIPCDYLGPQSHNDHHNRCAALLGVERFLGYGLDDHAAHSTRIMAAIAKRLTDDEPGDNR